MYHKGVEPQIRTLYAAMGERHPADYDRLEQGDRLGVNALVAALNAAQQR